MAIPQEKNPKGTMLSSKDCQDVVSQNLARQKLNDACLQYAQAAINAAANTADATPTIRETTQELAVFYARALMLEVNTLVQGIPDLQSVYTSVLILDSSGDVAWQLSFHGLETFRPPLSLFDYGASQHNVGATLAYFPESGVFAKIHTQSFARSPKDSQQPTLGEANMPLADLVHNQIVDRFQEEAARITTSGISTYNKSLLSRRIKFLTAEITLDEDKLALEILRRMDAGEMVASLLPAIAIMYVDTLRGFETFDQPLSVVQHNLRVRMAGVLLLSQFKSQRRNKSGMVHAAACSVVGMERYSAHTTNTPRGDEIDLDGLWQDVAEIAQQPLTSVRSVSPSKTVESAQSSAKPQPVEPSPGVRRGPPRSSDQLNLTQIILTRRDGSRLNQQEVALVVALFRRRMAGEVLSRTEIAILGTLSIKTARELESLLTKE